jgi:glycosyltransferase involved in cell wall biosynthesis
MHIVALTHLFYPARGGTEISLQESAQGLVKKGHRVTVVTTNQTALEDFKRPRVNDFLPGEESRNGVRIIRLPLHPRQRLFLAKTGALALRSRLPGGERLWFMTHLPHLPQMIGIAGKLKPDLLYAVPFPTATIFYACLAAKRSGCPWAIQPHLHVKDMNSSLVKILNWIFPRASAIVTNTPAEKAFLTGQGLPEEKIHVLGQGIDLSLLRGGDGRSFRRSSGLTDETIILFLGRKVEGKGLDSLLQAMPLIWKERAETVLVLAGQSSPYFKALFTGHPLSRDQRIISVDDFPEEKKKDLLAACDLLALPSEAESFGVVFLEAWAKSKPVIGADIPAVRDMVRDGEDGLLIPYGHPESLAAAVLKLIKEPGLREVMGQRGRLKVENLFEIGKVTECLEGLFSGLVGR